MRAENESEFKQPVHEIMERRVSVRSYLPAPVPEDVKEKITAYYAGLGGPFDPGTRFVLLNKTELKANENISLGTYGFIKGASLFIAAAVEDRERAMEQLGYTFERLVCFLTSLGLGTCWLGGTFNKGAFKEALKPQAGELMPAVVAVGYSSKARTIIDFAINPSGQKRKRKEWGELFFTGTFGQPLREQDAGPYTLPLEMVRIAPSASNKQPWRIVLDNGNVHFYLRRFKPYSNMRGTDLQKIDMGIAMYHFEAGAREAGLSGGWEERAPDIEGIPRGTEYIITWIPA